MPINIVSAWAFLTHPGTIKLIKLRTFFNYCMYRVMRALNLSGMIDISYLQVEWMALLNITMMDKARPDQIYQWSGLPVTSSKEDTLDEDLPPSTQWGQVAGSLMA